MKKFQELFSHLRWKVELFFLSHYVISYIVVFSLIVLFLTVWLPVLWVVAQAYWGWIFSP